MVALEEKQVAYSTARALLRDGGGVPPALLTHTNIGRVPAFQHGDLWLTESSAIIEYLEETFPAPSYPRLLPADPYARAKARQWMSFVRSDLFALRTELSWWTCVYPAHRQSRCHATPSATRASSLAWSIDSPGRASSIRRTGTWRMPISR